MKKTTELTEHLGNQLKSMESMDPSCDFDEKMIALIQSHTKSNSGLNKQHSSKLLLQLSPAIAASVLFLFLHIKSSPLTLEQQLSAALSSSSNIESNLSLTNEKNKNPLFLAEMDELMIEIEYLDNQLQELYKDNGAIKQKLALMNKRLILLGLLKKLSTNNQELYRI